MIRWIELEALEGLVTPEIGAKLANLAAQVPQGQAIVEIGSYKGKSSCYLAEGARNGNGARVHCIDPWDLPGNLERSQYPVNDPATREAFERQVEEMGLAEGITQRRAFSLEAVKKWRAPIGLLFIDGDHRYSGALGDFQAWGRYVVQGGVVVFDDYHRRRRSGVRRAVEQVRAQDKRWGQWEIVGRLAIGRKL